jgi:D-alanyl-D-alanine carboxypeptidase
MGLSPSERFNLLPPARVIKRSSFIRRGSVIQKKTDLLNSHQVEQVLPRKAINNSQQSNDGSPERFAFRLRLVKPTPSFLDLKPVISAASFIAMWTDDDKPLWAFKEQEERQIASLTKIMTAYTVLGLCQEYNVKVREQWIPVHNRASYM